MSSLVIAEKILFTKELLALRNYEYIYNTLRDNELVTSIQLTYDEVSHMFGPSNQTSLMVMSINNIQIDFTVFLEDILNYETNSDISIDEFEQFLVEHNLKISPIVELLTKMKFVDNSFLIELCDKEINIEVIQEKINEKKEFILKNNHLLEIS